MTRIEELANILIESPEEEVVERSRSLRGISKAAATYASIENQTEGDLASKIIIDEAYANAYNLSQRSLVERGPNVTRELLMQDTTYQTLIACCTALDTATFNKMTKGFRTRERHFLLDTSGLYLANDSVVAESGKDRQETCPGARLKPELFAALAEKAISTHIVGYESGLPDRKILGIASYR